MTVNVDIKPGPPWEPSESNSGAPPDRPVKRGFDPTNPADRKLRSQLRWSAMFLVVIFAGFAFSILFNFGQAARTGAGSGFGDTKLLPLNEGKAFFKNHDVPDSNH